MEYKFRFFKNGAMTYFTLRDLLDYSIRRDIDITNVSDSEIMQWTGFTDKNGKEIYEHDIIIAKSFNQSPYEHRYLSNRSRLVVRSCHLNRIILTMPRRIRDVIENPEGVGECSGISMTSATRTRLEVFGNEYEKPHILRELDDMGLGNPKNV